MSERAFLGRRHFDVGLHLGLSTRWAHDNASPLPEAEQQALSQAIEGFGLEDAPPDHNSKAKGQATCQSPAGGRDTADGRFSAIAALAASGRVHLGSGTSERSIGPLAN